MIAEGWEIFPTLVERDVAELVCGLLEDPAPLASALARYTQTLVHGDWKLGNLGIRRERGHRIVLLDWAFVGPAPAPVELAWYLAVNCARLPISKEETTAHYRAELRKRLGADFSEEWWTPALQLALLGGFVMLGWPKALGAARGETEERRARELAELAWWSARAREAARWL